MNNVIIVPLRRGDHFRTQARWALMEALARTRGLDVVNAVMPALAPHESAYGLALTDDGFLVACEAIMRASDK